MKLCKAVWVTHVARVGDRRGAYRVLMRNGREGDHLEDPGVDGRIISNESLRGWIRGHRLDRSGSG